MENEKELIDFADWLVDNPNLLLKHFTTAYVVNRYLKSIDSAQGENSNVSDNEKEEKICHLCGNTGRIKLFDTIGNLVSDTVCNCGQID